MKRNIFVRTAIVLGLTAVMVFNPNVAAMANTNTTPPAVARTKAWDAIRTSLGGIPESVKKIEYAGSIFYLGKDITEENFLTVIEAGPEAVRLKPPQDNGKLYNYPCYIVWNSDKTVLLVHPIVFNYEDVLEAIATPTPTPVALTVDNGKTAPKEETAVTLTEKQKYMLSDEYADALRKEFYRLLNEHRVANGLKKLEVNLELQEYADIRADEQRTQSGHTRPDGTPAGSGWHNSWNVINSRYAENSLGTGALGADPKRTALGIFNIWKESKGHNRHMLYDFDPEIKMALGIVPKLDDKGFVTSGAIFATGY